MCKPVCWGQLSEMQCGKRERLSSVYDLGGREMDMISETWPERGKGKSG